MMIAHRFSLKMIVLFLDIKIIFHAKLDLLNYNKSSDFRWASTRWWACTTLTIPQRSSSDRTSIPLSRALTPRSRLLLSPTASTILLQLTFLQTHRSTIPAVLAQIIQAIRRRILPIIIILVSHFYFWKLENFSEKRNNQTKRTQVCWITN